MVTFPQNTTQPTMGQPIQAGKPANQPATQPVTQKMPFKTIGKTAIQRGDLVLFSYLFAKNDRSPLILVSGVYGDRISGINLHYLTLSYLSSDFKSLIEKHCGNRQFSYQLAKQDQYITQAIRKDATGGNYISQAFRIYKKDGIGTVTAFDCEFAANQLNAMRSERIVNPQEIKAVREMLFQRLQKQVNPTATELARSSNEVAAMPMPQPGPMPARPATIPTQPATIPTQPVIPPTPPTRI